MTDDPPRAVLYWRPACGFCWRLRRGLRRRGIELEEIDIWAQPDAAARVRSATGGNETVPTVMVGELALVNPSTAEVEELLAAHRPDLLSEGGSRS